MVGQRVKYTTRIGRLMATIVMIVNPIDSRITLAMDGSDSKVPLMSVIVNMVSGLQRWPSILLVGFMHSGGLFVSVTPIDSRFANLLQFVP